MLHRDGLKSSIETDYLLSHKDAEVIIAGGCLMHDLGMSIHRHIGHRKGGRPLTIEAGVVRVADALDMEQGRSRVSFETSLANIHSLSAAAIDEVRIVAGEERAVRVEVLMNNSAGVFQVDELLASKLRGSGLEKYIEVVARIDAEHEKRLLRVYQI